MILYLDTSALVKLWTREPGWAQVDEAIRAANMLGTSVVTYAEMCAAFARAERERRWTLAEHEAAIRDLDRTWPGLTRVRVSNALAHEAGDLARRHRLRGFDAIHLASALKLGRQVLGEQVAFACFDERLVAGGRAERLEIVGGPV